MNLIGAGYYVARIIFADAEIVGAFPLAYPKVVVDFIYAGGGGIIIDVELIDSAALLYLTVDGGKQVFELGVVAAARYVISLYVFIAVEEATVGAVVVVDSVEIVAIKYLEGFGENEVSPLFAACGTYAVLEVSSGSAIELSYGEFFTKIGVEFVQKS